MLDAASPPRNLRVLNFLFKEGLGSTLGRCCAIVITPGVITVPASLHIDVLKFLFKAISCGINIVDLLGDLALHSFYLM